MPIFLLICFSELSFFLLFFVVLEGGEVRNQESFVLALDLPDPYSVPHLALNGRRDQSEDVELSFNRPVTGLQHFIHLLKAVRVRILVLRLGVVNILNGA